MAVTGRRRRRTGTELGLQAALQGHRQLAGDITPRSPRPMEAVVASAPVSQARCRSSSLNSRAPRLPATRSCSSGGNCRAPRRGAGSRTSGSPLSRWVIPRPRATPSARCRRCRWVAPRPSIPVAAGARPRPADTSPGPENAAERARSPRGARDIAGFDPRGGSTPARWNRLVQRPSAPPGGRRSSTGDTPPCVA